MRAGWCRFAGADVTYDLVVRTNVEHTAPDSLFPMPLGEAVETQGETWGLSPHAWVWGSARSSTF